MIKDSIKLFSWVDIEEVLLIALENQEWPEELFKVSVYWESIDLTVKPGSIDKITQWFENKFTPRFDRERGVILEAATGHTRYCSLYFEEEELSQPDQVYIPTLARPKTLRNGRKDLAAPEPFPNTAPLIFAFHSFKGGVGRTLHAIALAHALDKRGGRVLLVDGDFEAPGLSWILRNRLPDLPTCYADFLAVAQGDATPGFQETLELISQELGNAVLDGITLMPAFRTKSRWNTLEIRPEHLNNSDHPFRLTDLLANLGEKLGVDVIIVDTRAGLSELSTGLLLDPRINRILVTTPSGQAIAGTLEVTSILEKYSRPRSENDPLPGIIISMVLKELVEQNAVPGEAELRKALEGFQSGDSAGSDIEIPLYPLISTFDQDLLSLPLDWDRVLNLLEKSNLMEGIRAIAATVPLKNSKKIENSAPARINQASSLDKLIKFIEPMEYAEVGDLPPYFMKTPPLQRLAADHRTKLPRRLILGAKGAGKTYTYLQLARLGRWKDFYAAVGVDPSTMLHPDARLFPLLYPANINNRNLELLTRQDNSLEGVFGVRLTQIELRDHLGKQINSVQNLEVSFWRDLWLDLIAWRCGYEKNSPGAGKTFPNALDEKNESLIVLVDGLEDFFQDLGTNLHKQTALKALVQDVPEWLSQHPVQTLGILIFVRRDLVQYSVKQNLGHLEQLHRPYQLDWHETEALRLVAWICIKAQVLGSVEDEGKIYSWSMDELQDFLVPLWGLKLGTPRSKEAITVNWVLAVLADLKQQLQARDLVRLLKESAGNSQKDEKSPWTDRLLLPQAIRDSIKFCSEKKVEEVKMENQVLKRIFEHIAKQPPEKRSVPFRAENLDLSLEDVETLEDHGVVFVSSSQEFLIPEIYRYGLEFTTSKPGRVMVQNLQKQARRKKSPHKF